jgi:hypothetical protein
MTRVSEEQSSHEWYCLRRLLMFTRDYQINNLKLENQNDPRQKVGQLLEKL